MPSLIHRVNLPQKTHKAPLWAVAEVPVWA
jgi:hypothetical protein